MADILSYRNGAWVEMHDMQIFGDGNFDIVGQAYIRVNGEWDPIFETKFEYLDGTNDPWKAYPDSNDVGGVYK